MRPKEWRTFFHTNVTYCKLIQGVAYPPLCNRFGACIKLMSKGFISWDVQNSLQLEQILTNSSWVNAPVLYIHPLLGWYTYKLLCLSPIKGMKHPCIPYSSNFMSPIQFFTSLLHSRSVLSILLGDGIITTPTSVYIL